MRNILSYANICNHLLVLLTCNTFRFRCTTMISHSFCFCFDPNSQYFGLQYWSFKNYYGFKFHETHWVRIWTTLSWPKCCTLMEKNLFLLLNNQYDAMELSGKIPCYTIKLEHLKISWLCFFFVLMLEYKSNFYLSLWKYRISQLATVNYITNAEWIGKKISENVSTLLIFTTCFSVNFYIAQYNVQYLFVLLLF